MVLASLLLIALNGIFKGYKCLYVKRLLGEDAYDSLFRCQYIKVQTDLVNPWKESIVMCRNIILEMVINDSTVTNIAGMPVYMNCQIF